MSKKLKFEVITSRSGVCIAIDGHRVAGTKPLGVGTIERTMFGTKEDIMRAIGNKKSEENNFEFSYDKGMSKAMKDKKQ